MSCLDAYDGETIWQERLGQGDNCYASPVVAGDRINVVSASGRLSIAEVADEYRPVQTIELEERVLGSPAISGGVLLVRSDKSGGLALASQGGRIFYAIVSQQVEYDETIWRQQDAQRERREQNKLKRRARQLGYELVPIQAG